MKIVQKLVIFIFTIFLQVSFAASPNYTVLFTGKLNKKMVILDLRNERKIEGTRKNLRKLLSNKNFRKSLRRDTGMEPDVLRKSLIKNKNIGKESPVSKKVFNKIKNDKLYQKREILRSKLKSIKNKKSCIGKLSAFLIAVELNSEVDVTFDQDDINRQIKKDDRDDLNNMASGAISDLENINKENVNCIPGNAVNELDSEDQQIEVYCEKRDEENSEEKIKDSNYRETAIVLLAEREIALSLLLPDPLADDYDIKVSFLLNQIKNIKIFLKKDEMKCFNPYDGFDESILLSVEPIATNKTKDSKKEVKCDYTASMFGINTGVKYGKECYAQRVSCMDKEQKDNFEKIKDSFEFEDPKKNAFVIKFPIYNSDTKKIEENYSYKKGDYYDIDGVNERRNNITLQKVSYNENGDLIKEEQSTPEYFMKDSDGKYSALELNNSRALKSAGFKKAKYPFFRPTDQCSAPMQGNGRVCFQEACRQHDLCFQTLTDTKTTRFDQHFNKCNNKFERNIGKLCDENIKKGLFGWTGNMGCHSVKKVFYGAVQWAEGVGLDKGKSFKQSQKDQHKYLTRLYENIERKYCLRSSSQICLDLDEKINNLETLSSKD